MPTPAPSLDPVSVGLETLQAGLGIYQSLTGAAKAKKILGKRTAYKTPQEIIQGLQASEANASMGFDPATLQYLTSQTDEAYSGYVGAVNRMGGDINDLSAGYHDKINSIMKIGSDNHAENMKNFQTYLNSLAVVGENKAAEWRSQQDLLKDKQQQAAGDKADGVKNIGSAVNAFIGTQSAAQIAALYGEDIPAGGQPLATNTIRQRQAPGRIATSADNPLTGGSLFGG